MRETAEGSFALPSLNSPEDADFPQNAIRALRVPATRPVLT